MQVNDGVLGRLERRIRELDVPVAIKLWNGCEVAARETPRVRVTVRSPAVLPELVRPTMGNLARHYVEQRLDIVVVQARPVSHVSRFDLQRPSPWPVLDTQRRAQQIIECVTEGGSPGPALALHPVHNVVV